MSLVYEKFYDDIFAVLSRWEFIILRVEALLLWERIIPSFFFNLTVHLFFWAIAITTHSTLFILSCILAVLLACDIFWKWIRLLLDDPSHSQGSFTHFVETALKEGHILSIEDLSHWAAKFLYYIMSIVNGLAPCRRGRPLLFFLLTTCASLACIALSRHVSGLVISYGILNLCLIAPVLIYHQVLHRLWSTVKPFIERIEAEFDKNALETVSEREAGEAELYGPIVAAAAASHPDMPVARSDDDDDDDDGYALSSDRVLYSRPHRGSSGAEDLDTSEAIFIKQFVPKLSNEEIDRLFDNALGGASAYNSNQMLFEPTPDFTRLPRPTAPDTTPWIMSDEYATDDDEVEEIQDEVMADQLPETVHPRITDRNDEGFVVVSKSQ